MILRKKVQKPKFDHTFFRGPLSKRYPTLARPRFYRISRTAGNENGRLALALLLHDAVDARGLYFHGPPCQTYVGLSLFCKYELVSGHRPETLDSVRRGY